MQLTPKQEQALEKIRKHDFSQKPFFLGGCAGTGKTTILKVLADEYGINIMFLAPTGKACQVLKSKMPKDAQVFTIHSFLYTAHEITSEEIDRLKEWAEEESANGDYARKELQRIEEERIKVRFIDKGNFCLDDTLVVVDESSMIREQEFVRLTQKCKKLVFVGDPFQLPPVKSRMMFPQDREDFDVFLDEVHRAALESPITRLATEIRRDEFKGWKYWSKEIELFDKLPKELLPEVDQVICGKHTTRKKLIRVMRKPLETEQVVVGDKIIIKENIRKQKGELYAVNGDIGRVTQISGNTINLMLCDDSFRYLRFCDELMAETYGVDTKFCKIKPPSRECNYFVDFANAITCHSSQGSEWGTVLFYDDGMCLQNKLDRRRLVYTSVTRAKERLIYVRNFLQ